MSSLPVQCRVGSLEKRLVLPAVSEPVRSSIRLPQPLTMLDADEPLEVVFSAADVEPRTIRLQANLLPVAQRTNIVLDGNDREWGDIQAVRVALTCSGRGGLFFETN